jgi:hypothetical protein
MRRPEDEDEDRYGRSNRALDRLEKVTKELERQILRLQATIGEPK